MDTGGEFIIKLRPQAIPFYRGFHACKTSLLNLEQFLLPCQPHLFIRDVRGVIPLEHGHPAIFQFRNVCDHGVEQVAIMRDDDHRPCIFTDQFFKIQFTRQIEMIIRFIQQEDIRFDQKQPCQPDQFFLTAA